MRSTAPLPCLDCKLLTTIVSDARPQGGLWGNRLVTKSCTYQELVRDIRGDGPPRSPCQPSVPETACYDL